MRVFPIVAIALTLAASSASSCAGSSATTRRARRSTNAFSIVAMTPRGARMTAASAFSPG